MIGGVFKEPVAVASLEPHILERLHDQFPNQRTGAEWYRSGVNPDKPELLAALYPLTQLIIERETKLGLQPFAIFFELDTRDVAPGQTQRVGHWHIDNEGKPRPAYIVADALPTEFLVRLSQPKIAGSIARRQLIRQAFASTQLTDEAATALNLEIRRPKAHELIRMQKQIHRSSRNKTNETIERTWLRASVFRRQQQIRAH